MCDDYQIEDAYDEGYAEGYEDGYQRGLADAQAACDEALGADQ